MSGPRASDGFSLVELLVVIAIVSILTVSATLAVPRAGGGGAPAAATAFRDDVAALRLAAMLSGRDHAVAPLPGGWQGEAAGAGGRWSGTLRREPKGVEVSATAERLILHADGSLSDAAFTITDGSRSARCARGADGGLACASG